MSGFAPPGLVADRPVSRGEPIVGAGAGGGCEGEIERLFGLSADRHKEAVQGE